MTSLPGFPGTEGTSLVVRLSVQEPDRITRWPTSGQSAQDCAETWALEFHHTETDTCAHGAEASMGQTDNEHCAGQAQLPGLQPDP